VKNRQSRAFSSSPRGGATSSVVRIPDAMPRPKRGGGVGKISSPPALPAEPSAGGVAAGTAYKYIMVK